MFPTARTMTPSRRRRKGSGRRWRLPAPAPGFKPPIRPRSVAVRHPAFHFGHYSQLRSSSYPRPAIAADPAFPTPCGSRSGIINDEYGGTLYDGFLGVLNATPGLSQIIYSLAGVATGIYSSLSGIQWNGRYDICQNRENVWKVRRCFVLGVKGLLCLLLNM
ncbi:hypothetical protein ZEAMMB73_Zm00001d035468 [Zea mays]|uniref:Uncharacterized protein n=1 Tax=Zea mays TaxID=4577 RepID=A0A1D6LGH6_MAIZE|nr:hypothetical protein ZEAMMB73_Zm00001d035468 [Zea mays]AQK79017.1 hypothetical protein ZEAMMB73_Zm00001d035468 [Zea mays]AQK79022.1 hypothetical protein ZEAMMB73_Zm00001d035468 [Zea mays]